MSDTNFNPADFADWGERNLGTTVTRDGERGTVSGYSTSDGYCWVSVELDDGSTAEWLAEDVAEVR